MKSLLFFFFFSLVFGLLQDQQTILIGISNFSPSNEQYDQNSPKLKKDIGSPLEELLKIADKFIEQSSTSNTQESQKYEQYQQQHFSYNQFINASLEQNSKVIEMAKNKIDIINPKIEELSKFVEQNLIKIESTLVMENEESEMRAQEQWEFNNDINNFNDGIKICQQCINTFFVSKQNKIPIALNQIDSTKRKLLKLATTIFPEKDEYRPMLSALMEILDNIQEGKSNEMLQSLGELQDFIWEQKQIKEENEIKKEKIWEERKNQLKTQLNDLEEDNNRDQQELVLLQDEKDNELKIIEEQNEEFEGLKQTFEKQQQIIWDDEQIHQNIVQQYEEDQNQLHDMKELILVKK